MIAHDIIADTITKRTITPCGVFFHLHLFIYFQTRLRQHT